MRICLDGDSGSTSRCARRNATGRETGEDVSLVPRDDHNMTAEGGVTATKTTGFSLVLDEQWRGTAERPSMKMV